MKYFPGIAALLLIISIPVAAQDEYVPSYEDTLMVYEDLFFINEPLHLTMEFGMKTFKRTRQKERYQPAQLTCHVNESFQVIHPVRIKARGFFRRNTCTTPPFWLNIRDAGIEAESLKEVKKIKMVVRCSGAGQYEDYILREYLVYKIYNIINPHSFNVRLVKLKIIDTESKNQKTTEDWAFMIEPEEMMANRLTAKVVKSDVLSIRTVNKEMMDLVAFYMYMIGNGDFSVTGRHNLKILAVSNPDLMGFIPVPYDFDYTGLVNTHYAIPGDVLGIKNVRERYYLGPCRSDDAYMEAIQELESYKEEIFELVLNFEYLDEDEKMDMIGYMESYFSAAEKDYFIDQSIKSTCR